MVEKRWQIGKSSNRERQMFAGRMNAQGGRVSRSFITGGCSKKAKECLNRPHELAADAGRCEYY